MDAELVMKQVATLKKTLQSLETLVNEDIFRMLDNMSLCVTQKDNEVQQLASKVGSLETLTDKLQTQLKA